MISIKTSETNKDKIATFATKLGLVRNDNIVARLAFSYSISKGRKLSLVKDLKDSKGKEYKEDTLLGERKNFYLAVICQFYEIHKSSPDIFKYLKMHIDDGLEQMDVFFESNPNLDAFDFIIQNIERGIESIEQTSNTFHAVSNTNPLVKDKGAFGNFINLEIGIDSAGKKIVVPINDTTRYNNSHIAIAGQSGSGKTQFALDILYQIAQQSNDSTNFVYLDFKGLNPDDERNLQTFFQQTNTTLINAPLTKFPLNPLGFIDNVNETNKKLGIGRFAEIISSYHDAGSSRIIQLKDAIKTCFSNKKSGEYPTIEEIYEEVKNNSGTAKNKIINTLDGLSDPPVFDSDVNKDFLNQNYYFSLAGTLSEDVRFTAIFLIINYIFQQFMAMPDAVVVNGARSLRYVILIDEAQILFREPAVAQVIQVILEQIRSKGVAVMLVAQNIKEKTNSKLINSFLGYSEAEGRKLIKSLESIDTGQAVANCKELKRAELFNVSQFWKRK